MPNILKQSNKKFKAKLSYQVESFSWYGMSLRSKAIWLDRPLSNSLLKHIKLSDDQITPEY